ncbi:methylmalonyl-CoA epimerase [Anaerolinea thermolimosa]|uniref:VOC family protein n=1 Tax=Anaerolinea thermolimosa TaxID=229919 RepID=UPI000785DC3D|nr:VOC family protein [Anaerolinea thermolimosa]GAP06498.1 methylmalonyl-CoA epimerase [Anaerolinea thermolimosa]
MEERVGLGTNIITQIGIVVHDIEKYIDAYCSILGLPRPQVILTDEYEKARTIYQGKPTYARAKLAFFDMGQVQIELIEPVDGPSTWKEFLENNGEGVHHIAFQIKDTPDVVTYLENKGIPMVQQGYYTGGMYSYLDASSQLGVILELLENF